MSLDYKTRASAHGLALQVCALSSRRYVRIIREADAGVVWRFDSAPFAGSLRALYAAFQKAAAPIAAKGRDDLTEDEIATLERLRALLRRNDAHEYVLAA